MLVAVRYAGQDGTTGRPLAHSDYNGCCINKTVLLRMST